MNTNDMKNMTMSETNISATDGQPGFYKTVILGGIILGLLDATNGVIAFGLAFGYNPIQVLQFIASGALGTAAFQGGLATALLGFVFHYIISFAAAGAFYAASLAIPALHRNWVVFGLLFGAAVYLFMNFVVLPFSNVPPSPFSIPLFLNGIIGHAIFVGLPPAYFANRSARETK